MSKYIPIILLLIIVMSSCREPEPEPTETDILNEWIWDVMTEIYLWEEDIDRSLFPTEMTDPEEFFNSLLVEQDKFSWIVDDLDELVASFNNVSLSSGISPYFIRRSESDEVIVVVEYIMKGSPAEAAGIERGDIITKINGETLDITNYSTLFYQEELSFSFSDYIDGTLVENDLTIDISAVVIEENPVLHSEILEFEDKKIGYFVYTGFSYGEDGKWIDSMDYVLKGFYDEGIDELIVDLRYNPGGQEPAVKHLASVICPANLPGSDEVFVSYSWNDLYQDHWEKSEGNKSDNLVILFEDAVDYSLNLENVYFLTGWHSASASELIIIGLEPYMNVVQIGEATYGKCYGSWTIPDFEDPARHNWAMQPIVFKYANANGFTDFIEGLIPDYEVEDDILNALPFGDTNDPIIAKAIELITGTSPLTKKSASKSADYEVLSDPVKGRKALYSKGEIR